MPISIQPYSPRFIPEVKAFNQRLAAGGISAEFQFPESDVPHWLPKKVGRTLYQQYYLALDGETVRGAFILKYQDFLVRGQIRRVVYYHLPISEGIVNKSYAGVGVLMMRSALKMEPSLFALGMGGFDRPLPTMLKALGWHLSAVPFFFRIEHPAKFLRQIAPLRQQTLRRVAADAAAWSGLGWLGVKVANRLRSRRLPASIQVEPVMSFADWADALWKSCAPGYPLIAERTSGALNILYPQGKNFLSCRVALGGETLGWFVGLDTQMRGNKYFGDLRVGTIVDAFASPANAWLVAGAAASFLRQRGVDLVVANHSHLSWGGAFRSAGFLQGPSNFIFAASRGLAQQLDPFPEFQDSIYFMRGDGDGPVNL